MPSILQVDAMMRQKIALQTGILGIQCLVSELKCQGDGCSSSKLESGELGGICIRGEEERRAARRPPVRIRSESEVKYDCQALPVIVRRKIMSIALRSTHESQLSAEPPHQSLGRSGESTQASSNR